LIGREAATIVLGVEPDDPAGVHARGAELVADVCANVVIHERGEHRSAQPESVGQAVGDIGLAAALVDARLSRQGGRHIERVEAQHHLT